MSKAELGNAFQVIARIQWGWSAPQIRAAVRHLSADDAVRWYQVLSGAQAAFQSLNLFAFARVAEELCKWLEGVSIAKDCSHERVG